MIIVYTNIYILPRMEIINILKPIIITNMILILSRRIIIKRRDTQPKVSINLPIKNIFRIYTTLGGGLWNIYLIDLKIHTNRQKYCKI